MNIPYHCTYPPLLALLPECDPFSGYSRLASTPPLQIRPTLVRTPRNYTQNSFWGSSSSRTKGSPWRTPNLNPSLPRPAVFYMLPLYIHHHKHRMKTTPDLSFSTLSTLGFSCFLPPRAITLLTAPPGHGIFLIC